VTYIQLEGTSHSEGMTHSQVGRPCGPRGKWDGPWWDVQGTRRDNGTTHCRKVPGRSMRGPLKVPSGPWDKGQGNRGCPSNGTRPWTT